PAHHVVEVPVPVHIHQPRALAAVHEERVAADRAEGTDRRVHTARDQFLRTREEPRTLGIGSNAMHRNNSFTRFDSARPAAGDPSLHTTRARQYTGPAFLAQRTPPAEPALTRDRPRVHPAAARSGRAHPPAPGSVPAPSARSVGRRRSPPSTRTGGPARPSHRPRPSDAGTPTAPVGRASGRVQLGRRPRPRPRASHRTARPDRPGTAPGDPRRPRCPRRPGYG